MDPSVLNRFAILSSRIGISPRLGPENGAGSVVCFSRLSLPLQLPLRTKIPKMFTSENRLRRLRHRLLGERRNRRFAGRGRRINAMQRQPKAHIAIHGRGTGKKQRVITWCDHREASANKTRREVFWTKHQTMASHKLDQGGCASDEEANNWQ